MASVVIAGLPHHDDSLAALESSGIRAPAIEMVANPEFSFPIKPLTPSVSNEHPDSPRRPTSMFLQPGMATTAGIHKRTASALPTFSFNAANTSGRLDITPPQTPDEQTINFGTSSRKGHKRGGSEFVGGDSRFGVNNAITSSPTKSEIPLLSDTHPSPAGRRHAHRRSVAVSSHDLSQIMSTGDKSPRLSSSLPSSPLDLPTLNPSSVFNRPTNLTVEQDEDEEEEEEEEEEAHQAHPDDPSVRPPSRPRVDFVEEVEIIPRPLSTISSETESSVSTTIGHHSVSNSINSVLSGPSASHASFGSIAESRFKSRSSVEISKKVEKEGEWLKSRSSSLEQQSLNLGLELEAAQLTIVEPHVQRRQKRPSHSLGFDRRRSEPLISTTTSDFSRLSALSLQDAMMRETVRPATSDTFAEKQSSGQKLKQWALSKLHRRYSRPQSSLVVNSSVIASEVTESADVPGKVYIARGVVAETDLDAVFGNSTEGLVPQRFGTSPTQMSFDYPSPLLQSSRSSVIDLDDSSPMVDLDAALGPSRTPPLASSSQRRYMHSNRPSGGFLHRRAESEPVLMPFNYNRAASTPQKSMEDVFEEDEEDAQVIHEEPGMGITMVDADRSAFDPLSREALRLRRSAHDLDRPFTSYDSPTTSQLMVNTIDRPDMLVDDIITEECSPTGACAAQIEIVEAHEEPRAASLEKSSDSSEASTLLGAPVLSLSDEATSPETYLSSSFSSPDFTRRQGSFDASRVGTSASSITDARTTSSCTTGEPGHEVRKSVDDVPSLTSSRSTMMSTIHANSSRRDMTETCTCEAVPRPVDPVQVATRRKKRASIQSLSQLVGGTFGSKNRLNEDARPQTAVIAAQAHVVKSTKKEHRLKKLMFWRSKQNLRQAATQSETGV